MISPTPNMIAEKMGPVGKLIFNKPAKHNATSTDMWEAIPVIIDEFEKDPAIRVVVVTGAGDKAFVSGADISEFEKARSTPEQVAYYDKIGEVANARLTKCSKPTIARIRGYCIGGGAGGVADLRHPHRLGQLQVRRAGGPARARLPRGRHQDPDGRGRARPTPRRSSSPRRMFSAQEALGMGLINRVVPDAELDAYVDNYCKLIGENAPLTMHAAKRTIEELTRLDGKPDFGRDDGAGEGVLRLRGLHRGPHAPSWKSAGRSSRDAKREALIHLPSELRMNDGRRPAASQTGEHHARSQPRTDRRLLARRLSHGRGCRDAGAARRAQGRDRRLGRAEPGARRAVRAADHRRPAALRHGRRAQRREAGAAAHQQPVGHFRRLSRGHARRAHRRHGGRPDRAGRQVPPLQDQPEAARAPGPRSPITRTSPTRRTPTTTS